MTKHRCSSRTKSGAACRAWAVPGSNPPTCAAHGGVEKAPGAPQGNHNAVKHGFYANYDAPHITIEQVIADLAAKQDALSAYIDRRLEQDTANAPALAALFALHAQTASRLGRLLRDRRALSGDAADGIAGAIAQALDELSNELGTEL